MEPDQAAQAYLKATPGNAAAVQRAILSLNVQAAKPVLIFQDSP